MISYTNGKNISFKINKYMYMFFFLFYLIIKLLFNFILKKRRINKNEKFKELCSLKRQLRVGLVDFGRGSRGLVFERRRRGQVRYGRCASLFVFVFYFDSVLQIFEMIAF